MPPRASYEPLANFCNLDKMQVVLFRDLKQEHWASIEVYADRLGQGLRKLNIPGWSFHSAYPAGVSLPGLAIPSLYFSRTLLYGPYARWHQSDVNHVLDNSYGHLVHFVDSHRTVVTSHGGTPISWRRWNREGPSMRFFDWAFQGTLKAARVIIVSNYAKRELLEHFDYDPARIRVVYHGVDDNYHPLAEKTRIAVRAKYLIGNEKGILLHVGHCARRKNIEGLLGAFARLLKEASQPYRLIQIGGRFSPELFRLIDQLEIGDRVTQIASMPNEQLVEMYNAADVFVFPSLYEGFGVPLIEAMACGTPVVCSDLELFREVCGEAVVFADSSDHVAFACAIAESLDESKADYLRKRGLERAAQFTWERTARETLAVYQELA
jgi:glycosyltransferase involved in cell wall biosynthesis